MTIQEQKQLTLVCFGDSLTAQDYKDDDVPRLTPRLRQAFPQWHIVNSGVRKETTRMAMTRFQSDVLDHKPDLVTIFFGANDMAADERLVPLDEYRALLHSMIEQLAPARVLLVTPALVNEATVKKRTLERAYTYADSVRQVASEAGVALIDVQKHMLETPDWLSLLVEDGLHLNEKGYEFLSKLFIEALQSI